MNDTYIVKEGDTLGSIADLFGVGVVDLIRLNNLGDSFYIEPGMKLLIPRNRNEFFEIYTVQEGDTLYSIANKHGLTPDTLAAINGLKLNEYIHKSQEIIIPKPGIATYLTKMGDTLRGVASYLKTTPGELILDNNNIYLLPEQLMVVKKRIM